VNAGLFEGVLRELAGAASRRGLLTAVVGGLVGKPLLPLGPHDVAARGKHHQKRKRKHKRPSPPPFSPTISPLPPSPATTFCIDPPSSDGCGHSGRICQLSVSVFHDLDAF
jgi:hypothetical protein